MKNQYYTYIYLDPRKPGKFKYGEYKFDYEPFYVGKGRDDRYIKHLAEAYNHKDQNPYKCRIIRKIKKLLNIDPIILKHKEDLTDKQSLKEETKMIKIIGRHDLKKGPLSNLTDGGEGSSGIVCKPETRKKRSLKMSGNLNPFYGKKHTKEAKMKNAKAHKRANLSKETLKKMSDIKKGKVKSKETLRKISENSAYSKALMIDGKSYRSITEAARNKNVSNTYIRDRLNNKWKTYTNYKYI